MLTGYIAFLDVMGFTSLVRRDHNANQIDKYLDSLNDIFGANNSGGRAHPVQYVAFSDSIVLTTNDDSEESLQALFCSCSGVFGRLLGNEIPVRGAISHGSFTRSDTGGGTFVAGAALIDAYQFEQKQDWVGIMVTPSVITKVSKLQNYCEIGHAGSDEAYQDILQRCRWAAFVQRCDCIPFHPTIPNNITGPSNYDGMAVVPSDGNADPILLAQSLGRNLQKLNRLRAIAPDSSAQMKYARAIVWLQPVANAWRTVNEQAEARASQQRIKADIGLKK
jgi:hypothetical protein